MSHVVVVGAGVTGVTSAHFLLKMGHQVSLIDRHGYAAMETSYANGGQLSASNAQVWNSWSTITKGLAWVFRSGAPLLVNPKPNFHKYAWLAEFCAQIPHARDNTVQTTKMAILARRHLLDIARSENIEFDYLARGILHLYHDKKSYADAVAGNTLLQAAGLERTAVTGREIHQIEPTLTGEFHGGFFTPSDATGDIHKFTTGLAESCRRRGAKLHFDTTVQEVKQGVRGSHVVELIDSRSAKPLEPIAADAVLLCAGVSSRALAAALGDRINIYPVKGYSITVGLSDAANRANAPTVSLLDDAAKIVSSRLGDARFRVAGTAEFNGENRDIRADRIAPLVKWCRKLFPALNTREVIPWAGLRPMTPSMLPRVGRGKQTGIYYNTGHGHLGWTLAAATASIVANLIDADSPA